MPLEGDIQYTEAVRRLLVFALVPLVAVTLAATAASGGPVQEQPTTSEGTPVDQDLIPDPDEGRAPDEAGDRGGALQYVVLGLMAVAIGGGIYAMVRESRRKRAEQSQRAA